MFIIVSLLVFGIAVEYHQVSAQLALPLGIGTPLPNVDDSFAIIGPGIGVYRYCGKNYKRMLISYNGFVAFGNFNKTGKIPPSYPTENGRYKLDLVAAYWAWHLGAPGGGAVSWRHSTAKTDKNIFKKVVLSRFGYKWKPKHMIIVNYLRMHAHAEPCPVTGCNRNYYQIALGTKKVATGRETYVILSYQQVEWTNIPPNVMVGLNQKDNGDRYIHQDSFSTDIKDITDDNPYVFRLDPEGVPGTSTFCFEDPDPAVSGYVWDFA